MKKKLCIAVIIIAIVVIGVVVVVGISNMGKRDVIRIGAVLPLTGPMAPYAESIMQGMDIAAEEINASGGINGQTLDIIYEDSQGDPRTGVSAFNKLNLVDKVPLIFSSMTGVILAIQPEADKQGVVLINTSALSPQINDLSVDFLFNLVLNGASEARFMANVLQKRFPNEKIAVLYANNPTGIYTINVLTKTLEELGNTNYITESFEAGTTDFRVHLDRIKRNGAKLGYMYAVSNKEDADILRQTKELSLDIQWFSVSGFENRETLELAREAANGVIYSYPKIINETLYTNFQNRFHEKYNYNADYLTVSTYETVNLIAEVMKRYGTKSTNIQAGLRSIKDFSGIYGIFKLYDSGKQFIEREMMLKTVINGEFVNYGIEMTRPVDQMKNETLHTMTTSFVKTGKETSKSGDVSLQVVGYSILGTLVLLIFFLLWIRNKSQNCKKKYSDTLIETIISTKSMVVILIVIIIGFLTHFIELGFLTWDGSGHSVGDSISTTFIGALLGIVTIVGILQTLDKTNKLYKQTDPRIDNYTTFYENCITLFEKTLQDKTETQYFYFSGGTLIPGALFPDYDGYTKKNGKYYNALVKLMKEDKKIKNKIRFILPASFENAQSQFTKRMKYVRDVDNIFDEQLISMDNLKEVADANTDEELNRFKKKMHYLVEKEKLKNHSNLKMDDFMDIENVIAIYDDDNMVYIKKINDPKYFSQIKKIFCTDKFLLNIKDVIGIIENGGEKCTLEDLGVPNIWEKIQFIVKKIDVDDNGKINIEKLKALSSDNKLDKSKIIGINYLNEIKKIDVKTDFKQIRNILYIDDKNCIDVKSVTAIQDKRLTGIIDSYKNFIDDICTEQGNSKLLIGLINSENRFFDHIYMSNGKEMIFAVTMNDFDPMPNKNKYRSTPNGESSKEKEQVKRLNDKKSGTTKKLECTILGIRSENAALISSFASRFELMWKHLENNNPLILKTNDDIKNYYRDNELTIRQKNILEKMRKNK
jgi:branched-chain amino acid transport system substrate-binding protein